MLDPLAAGARPAPMPAPPGQAPRAAPGDAHGVDPGAAREARLRDAAERLEASFLKEMLAAAGLGRAPGLAGGLSRGDEEGQWSSFLLDAQARELARAGGIGLAQSLFEALKARDGA